jgi:hypothetical protein
VKTGELFMRHHKYINPENNEINPELQKELYRIETELDVESEIYKASFRMVVAEFEKCKSTDYVNGYLDGRNDCITVLAEQRRCSEMKYKELEIRHPEWFKKL